MKKVIFILLFILLIAAKCDNNSQIMVSSSYVFENAYDINEETKSISDLYFILNKYGQDSIPLSKWPTFMGTSENHFVLQQMLTKRSDSINYIFIYSMFKNIDSTYYTIRVRKIFLK